MRVRYQKNFGVDVGVQQIENVDICSRVHYFATIGNRIRFVANDYILDSLEVPRIGRWRLVGASRVHAYFR